MFTCETDFIFYKKIKLRLQCSESKRLMFKLYGEQLKRLFLAASCAFITANSASNLWAAEEQTQYFSYEGRLYAADGVTPSTDTVNFKFQILNYNSSGAHQMIAFCMKNLKMGSV